MPMYRPRTVAYLTLPVFGDNKGAQAQTDESVVVPAKVREATLTVNDSNAADELDLTLDYLDVGIDPRLLTECAVQFYMGNAPDGGQWVPSADQLRFTGVMSKAVRSGRESAGMSVKMTFRDYTALFLETKNYPPNGMPYLSEDLTAAWQRICDHTGIPQEDGSISSTVKNLRDRIVYSESIGSPPVIGEACSKRLRGLGRVQVKPGADAWAVWKECCAMCGLMTFIRLDEVHVVDSTDYYTTEADGPRLVWGENILSIEEERSAYCFSAKGVGVTSFDPLTLTTLEAMYPPNGDPRMKKKKVTAARRTRKAQTPKVDEDREWFDYPSITDQNRLNDIAKRIYNERSRQTLEGSITTVEMRAGDFDLLSLVSGDTVTVEWDRAKLLETLSRYGSETEQIAALVARGYSPEIARLMARNMKAIQSLRSDFLVKGLEARLSTDENDGDFELTIRYCNRIDINGSTDDEAA